ncbi:secretin N-terminal domain-containing protein [Propionivibrio limicola]|uniref:secretin N-terminal domain-containing protein n=1 Tax=Propionivibrio limicola TaxID=167645 RepID=UPI001291C3F9|nr:secretin N-terminal domain-containing protein [Propionivibrio limicola]
MKPNHKTACRLLPLAFAGLLSACMTNSALDRSRVEFTDGDPATAFSALEQRVRQEPRNLELRAYYLRQRERLISDYLATAEQALTAGDLDRAEQAFRRVLEIDARHPRAAAGIESLADERRRQTRLAAAEAALARGDATTAERLARSVLAEVPANTGARRLLREADERRLLEQPANSAQTLGAMNKPVTLHFRDAPLRAVFEVLAQAAGLNFVFDREMREDTLVTLMVRNSTVGEILKLLATTQQIETRLVNTNSVLVYPATPAKQREYQELVSRSFYLAHADAKQVQAMLKQLVKTRDLFIDEKLNLVVIKDTLDAVRLAERLIASLDVAEPEVMLDVEVLEVNRTKLRDLGLELPDEIGYGLLASGDSGALVTGNVSLRDTSALVPYTVNPAAVLRILSEDSDTNLLANPRIRVKNRSAAKVHIGDKVPVFTTTSTANVGVAASVSYLDIGLKLDVEPSVTLDDQVAIKVGLEVSNIVSEVPGPEGSLAYRIGTRSAQTTLRLKNGETQVLAGLISDEDRLGTRRIPGLGDLPVLGRLFSSQNENGVKTEIVLLITPRILRNVVPPVSARDELPAGTEASIGAQPLRIGSTAPGGLSLRVAGTVTPAAALPAPIATPALPAPAPTPSPGPEGLAIRLSGPATAKAGETVALSLELGGRGSYDGGTADITYDAKLLEPVGITASAPGQARIALPAGTLPASQPVTFRVKAETGGMASIAVTGINLEFAGQRLASPASASTTITIGQ